MTNLTMLTINELTSQIQEEIDKLWTTNSLEEWEKLLTGLERFREWEKSNCLEERIAFKNQKENYELVTSRLWALVVITKNTPNISRKITDG